MEDKETSELAQKVKKVQQSFYGHIIIYILVNLFYFINNARLGNSDSKGFYFIIIWGVGIAIHWYFLHLQEEAYRKELNKNK